MSQFKTAKRGSRRAEPPTARAKAVDLVTGKAVVEYFFDPTLILDESGNSRKNKNQTDDDILLNSKHLFVPCKILKSLADDDSNGSGNNNKKSGKKKKGGKKDGQEKAEVTSGPALVKTADGTLYKIKEAQGLMELTAPDDYVGMSDVLHLANVSEASLLNSLRIRYKRDDIYTSAGPILISINPYKQIKLPDGESLYSDDIMMSYRGGDGYDEEEPHLFQVADRAYSHLMDSVHNVPHLEDDDLDVNVETDGEIGLAPGDPRNQSIIISGESGAGKTEATKYIMKYLARITKKKDLSDTCRSEDGKIVASLEDRVLSSNPLLESFGNAQTLRNDNSSRFGKFIHINFSTATGAIVGARISNYLLEKTRITTQIEGERNYHIFYQLFAGAQPESLEKLGLGDGTAAFKYLGSQVVSKSDKDAGDFVETMECLARIGLTEEEQYTVFSLAASVLHLGNITFEEDDSENHAASISEVSLPSLQKACELLGLEEAAVKEAILTKNLTINGKTIKKTSSVAMAEDKRDALAKMTYSSLFLWLVKSINQTLTNPAATGTLGDAKIGFIGVLDIYGFETFEVNGYEQLLINYCNEKLQRHFNRHLFEVEQNLYSSEGVDWTYITFNDNRPCLELIEGGSGTTGILSTLDDSYAGMGTSSEKDVKFVSQLHKLFGSGTESKKKDGHDYFITPKFGNDRQFIIVHYAGEVRYTVDGFVERNMESLTNELRDLGKTSTVELARAAYACTATDQDIPQKGDNRRSSIRGFSVASQFKLSLQALVEDLERTQPHYIRCIKPNLRKAPNSFAAGDILKQLRYSGMMEAIRIRREGYALREDHQSFYNRFSVLLGPSDMDGEGGIEQLVRVLSKRLSVTDADWQIGHSKIFLRRHLSDKLERLAKLRVHMAARTVGRFGKLVVNRRLSAFLVAWVRFRLHMLEKYRKMKASTKIASWHRGTKETRAYKSTRAAIVTVQSLQRRRTAISTVRKMRDPFCDMTYKDLKKLLKAEKERMKEAVNSKDFRTAADIEAYIERISAVMEEREPMTRKKLEEKIEKCQNNLDGALKRKAYAEAGPLQDELDVLIAQRKDLPTLEELQEAVKKAEEGLAEAVKSRDFAGAAAAQSILDEAKGNLAAALEAEETENEDGEEQDNAKEESRVAIDGIESRSDLEEEITKLQVEIEEAISRKDFKGATALQTKLDERQKLRVFFPSIEELEAELQGTKEQMEACISKKDFSGAEKLHAEIERIEKSLESEKAKQSVVPSISQQSSFSVADIDGGKLEFSSRYDLEEALKVKKEIQSTAVSSKEFKKAASIQSVIDAMDKLRDYLPTVEEIRAEIKEKRTEMQKAVQEKRFSDAETLDGRVMHLEEKLSKEVEKAPKAPAVTKAKENMNQNQQSGSLSKGGIPIPVVSTRAGSKAKVPAMVGGALESKTTMKKPKKVVSATPGRKVAPSDASVGSVKSFRSRSSKTSKMTRNTETDLKSVTEDRPVSKLRPKKPLISSVDDSILAVTQMLASKRGDASLVVSGEGGLAGIITDTDVTRRVVAKHVDPASTSISAAMTPNPTCVSMTDSAMDAMSTMVENHFRHLPVVDENGGVVGLLDIAKCLNDAITKLERSQSKSGDSAQAALQQAMKAQGAQGTQAAALQALLGPLMSQAFGNQASPTLRSLLAGRPGTMVSPETTVRDAGMLMAERRKAALVVDDGELVGIFGFKDMMTRVVAKELSVDFTEINKVMTPNPEAVSPDMTVLEALQTMHDNKFLTLPVCEDDGTVVGLVDVMDVIYGCGGAEGWRSIFSSSLELDDLSETASVYSGIGSKGGSIRSRQSAQKKKDAGGRPVSKLRPKKPLITSSEDSVLSVTQMLASKRSDAALVVSSDGALAGIITDTDVTRRLVAKNRDAGVTGVAAVMTPNPTCVSTTDSAVDAMSTMVENHFRHLPVVDENGGVVGLLDIAKCLNDAISKLERSQAKSSGSAQAALQQAMKAQGAQGTQAAALQALLGPLMSQAFGNQASPTLRSLLAGRPGTMVSPDTAVRDAGMLMAERRKAALVVDDGELVGIFGFKDMMTRVVAKELSVDFTEVSKVMTPNPEAVSPDMTVLEALQTMHDNKFLTLPVCEDDGTVVGLVDVMDVIYGCGGAEGWRSIFSSSLELDDLSDAASAHSVSAGSVNSRKSKKQAQKDSRPVSKLRPKKPLISSVDDSILAVTQMLASKRGDASLVVSSEGGLAGIITDTDVTRRVVAKHVDPASTSISAAMTPNPTCVSMVDSAMDAMSTMVENHFRHLPVVDENGGVVGLLDIAKCLNDAITKLERSQSKSGDSAQAALQQAMKAQGAQGTQAAALQALLGPLMSQAFGNQASPTLRSLLAGRPGTMVSPNTTVRDAGMLMAERRKAALVVDDGELVGIFGFKDMMTRVVAKELSVDFTEVSKVMTPNPEAVSPDMTVLEALQTMHDNKFLTLPVCEDDGTVVGLVDVMDVIYGCGGAEGWRSIFSSSLELDDLSDSASMHSGLGSKVGSIRSRKTQGSVEEIRPVSKLRPAKPLISSVDDSILAVTQMLASKRGDASLVVSNEGGLAGIITDTDITRRVVAKHVDPASTSISAAMTPDPTCVSTADAAMDAMSTMVENHFRHLPVVDENGGVVGLLDIAKCLNDAITKLERSQSKSGGSAQAALQQAMKAQGAQGTQAAALQALLGPLMSQAFGNQASPTLRSLLAGRPGTMVSPETTVRDAGMLMAERRKAALVVDDGELVGIFGFKDMMTRVVAKELSVDFTEISKVMTPNPEAVSPDMTVLEALQTMHDNKFLTLPVCEDDGTVVGLVDVMDVIYGCGGAEGWRSIFSSSLELDDLSDSASVYSKRGGTVFSKVGTTVSATSKKTQDKRTVSMLRPKKPTISLSGETITDVSKLLASKRSDAAIIVSEAGALAGIITDTDITRRVVAKHLDPRVGLIDDVMTPDPKCVSTADAAMDAMLAMVENHFRHLPVLDDEGAVVGLLDIGKCLNDAISKLEKAQLKKDSSAEKLITQALEGSGNGGALQALLGPLLSQSLGAQATPTLRSILSMRPSTIVSPSASVLSAGLLMAETRKAALVVEDERLIGIFGFKDMMTRVVANDLDVETTCVADVMTPEPEYVSPEINVIEALQVMHADKFLTLPVCEEDGAVVGLVDVMDLIHACGGAEGWRSVFDTALDITDDSVTEHQTTKGETDRIKTSRSVSIAGKKSPAIKVSRDTPFVASSLPGNIPTTLEFAEDDHQDFDGDLTLLSETRNNTSQYSYGVTVQFKVVDPSGHTHRVRSEGKLSSLLDAFAQKVKISKANIQFKFVDDEGDAILVTSDDDLIEAIKLSRTGNSSSKSLVKLTAVEVQDSLDTTMLAGAAAAVAVVGIIAISLFRK